MKLTISPDSILYAVVARPLSSRDEAEGLWEIVSIHEENSEDVRSLLSKYPKLITPQKFMTSNVFIHSEWSMRY